MGHRARDRGSRGRLVALVGVLALLGSATACGGAELGAAPDPGTWTTTSDEELHFTVPPGAVRTDPPQDPEARTEFVLGDADDLAAPYVATYRSSARSAAGERVDVMVYTALLFGVGGSGLEGFSTSRTTLVDVPGAVEAGRLQVRYDEPNVDGTVVSDVLVVVTESHVYDLRFARVGDDAVPPEDVEKLFASVSVAPSVP